MFVLSMALEGTFLHFTAFVSSHDGVEDCLVHGGCQDAAHWSAYWGQLTDRSKPGERDDIQYD
jgi:hypothetical protein